jgi:hypothetical protein
MVALARKEQVPIFFLRLNQLQVMLVDDSEWRRAVDGTGGILFPIGNEDDIFAALKQIDGLATGTVRRQSPKLREPRFQAFVLTAALLWSVGIGLTCIHPLFRRFP